MKTSLLKLLFYSVVFFSSLSSYAANYYWVGGTGSWTDLTHWATTSGGSTKHTIVPGSADDVFFDANSFTAASQVVTVDDDASFRNMDWSAATNSPKIASTFPYDLEVYGYLILPASVARDLVGSMYFKSSSPYNLNLGNLPISNADAETLYFQGTGTCTLTGGIDANAISLTAGTLNTNGQPITCSVFGTTGSTAQAINLSNSNINVSTWNITSTNITVNAGTSSITSTFSFNGKNLTYNNLTISGSVSVGGSNTFNTITLNAASTLSLTAGTTQTISNLVSNGTVSNPVTIKSTVNGTQATLSKSTGAVSVNYVRVQDNNATGGATFTAPTGSVNLGNVTGWNITTSTPTVQTTSAFISKAVTTSVEVRWTVGNGASRIVVAKAGSAVNAAPVDLTAYTAGAFGTGTQIGTGNYVVYSGNADRATITGLTAGTTYHFAVYEFNGSGATARFLTTSAPVTNITTLPSTAVIISNSPVSICSGQYYDSGGGDLYNYSSNESFTQTLTPLTAGNKLKMDFDTNYDFFLGSGDQLKIYDGPNTSATLIGTYTGGTSPGVVTATNATGQLTIQFTSDATITSIGFGADISCVVPPLATQPTVQASALAFSNVGGTSLTLGWTNGNGNNRIVIARSGSAVAFSPVDATEYTSNANYGSGTDLGSGQFVVYNGSSNTVNVTNLTPSTTYHFAVIEYNKTASTSSNYLTPGAIGNRATIAIAAEPTTPASAASIVYKTESSLGVNWTNGNGVRRVVIMKQGSAVNAVPVDGVLYTSTQNFSTGADLGNGNKVVYSGTGGGPIITNLSPLTTYYFAVYEFNGTTAGVTNYLTTNPATVSGSTISPEPTDRPSFATTYTNFNSIEVNWTKGNAEKVLLVARSAPTAFSIADGNEYTGDPVFGQGQSLGANTYVVYSGSGTGVTITGLQMSTQYNLFIYGYNGSGAATNYNTSAWNTSITTLKMKPTVQASNVTITNVSADSMKINWQKGNGDLSMVVVRAGLPVSISVKDSTEISGYTNLFGQGYDFGNGNTLVYKGSENSVVVKNLNPSTTYYVAVYELNSTYVSQTNKYYSYYLTTNPPTANVMTPSGRKFYWVNGKGKWADFSHHWATASGGTNFYNSAPRTSDDVFFDENSFATDKDSVIIEGTISFNNMDWTKITKTAAFASKSSCLGGANVYGSIKLSNLMTINIGSITLWGSGKNVIDLANKTSLSSCNTLSVWGYGGEWTISGDLNLSGLTMYAGTLITDHALTIRNTISYYNLTPKRLELGNALVTVSSIKGGSQSTNNFIINGGRFVVSNFGLDTFVEAPGSHFKKLSLVGDTYNRTSILGTMSIDSLQINPGREARFESGKTFTIGQLILNGDSTKTTIISSTITGSAARFSKTDGKVNANYVVLKDNEATGGAQFIASNSVDGGNVSGWNITTPVVFLPKNSAQNIKFRRVFRTDLKMKWTSGDGIGRIVIAKEGNPVDRYPADGGTNFTGNSVFATGTDLGNGNFIVYNGKLDSANVSGLTPGKVYHFAVLEFNTWDNKIKYKRTSPAIANVSTVGASDIIFSNGSVSAGNVKFFDEGGNGFYTRNKEIVQTISPAIPGTKLGVLFTYFEMPALDSLIVYDGPSASSPAIGKFRYLTKPTNALIATNPSGVLTFKLKGSNTSETEETFKGWVAELFNVGNLSTEPTAQTSSLKVDARTSSSITLKAVKGNGSGRTIVARELNAVSKLPVDGLVFASQAFGQGTHLGENNYVVYSGSDETIVVSGLKQNTIYQFASVEFNGSGNTTNYLLTNAALVKDTTEIGTPTIATSNISFTNTTKSTTNISLTPGDGSGRIVLFRKNKAVSFVPTDGVTYSGQPVYGNTSVGDSTYVYNNLYYTTTVNNLEQLSTYYFKVIELNGTGKKTKYLTTNVATGQVTTLGPVITMRKIKDTYCPNASIEVPFVVSSAFMSGNKYTLQLSDKNGNFTQAVNLKDTTITALSGSIKAKIPNTVEGSTTYRLRIISSSPKAVSDSIRTTSIPNVPDVKITQDGSTFVSSITTGIQWLKNGTEITGATDATQSFTENGSYSVKITVAGCSKTSAPVVIMGLEDANSSWKIYPNPVRDQFEIEVTEQGSSYVIYDIQGKELIKGILSQKRSIINSKDLPAGMFLIRVTSGQSSSIKKIIKN